MSTESEMSGSSQMIHRAKASLRKELKQRLSVLTADDKQRQSEDVMNKLVQLPQYTNSERVSIYLSMDEEEVQTLPILKNLLNLGKKCFIPYFKGPTMKMVPLHSWDDYEQLPRNKWQIKQPSDDDVRDDALVTGGLDLIIMPGLGFTVGGARLGRGRGYYDSYLTKCSEQGLKPFTVALAFNEQICDLIPTSDTDVPLHLVLFPSMGNDT